MDSDLWPAITGGDTPLLLPDWAAPRIAIKKFVDFHAPHTNRIQQSQLIQFARGVGQDIQTHAQRGKLRSGFIDERMKAKFVQAECGHQAAHAGTDDSDAGHVTRYTSR